MPVPLAVITGVILLFTGGTDAAVQQHPFHVWQALPYFAVLVMAVIGLNVLLVLGAGIIMFALAGLITQPGFDIPTLFSSMGEGTKGMFETIIVAVLVAALGELIKENGGFEYYPWKDPQKSERETGRPGGNRGAGFRY